MDQSSTPETGTSDQLSTTVVCRNCEGLELSGNALRLTRHSVAFEVHAPFTVLRLSEALGDFRILSGQHDLYSGRAVVANLINTGAGLVCEATLEDSWLDIRLANSRSAVPNLQDEFVAFLHKSEEAFRVLPEFKLVLADMQIFLQNLRRWLEQLELIVQCQPSGSRYRFERSVLESIQKPILGRLALLFERFEESCQKIDAQLRSVHSSYLKRQLHPIVLCAPFMYRAFRKPLGYAGDYEMINMMVRDPYEGASLFAKVLNKFFLNTAPVVAHRNRFQYLQDLLAREVTRVVSHGRDARIYDLGCGPATEVQEFVTRPEFSGRAHFTLVDFNDETLNHVGKVLRGVLHRGGSATGVRLEKNSVQHLLKEASRSISYPLEKQFDFAFCTGLFDYFSDAICRILIAILYRMLAPGGLLVASNVDQCNPSRNWMEYAVDWHLIYRDRHRLAKLASEIVPPDDVSVVSEPTGVNLFIQIRKPEHG